MTSNLYVDSHDEEVWKNTTTLRPIVA